MLKGDQVRYLARESLAGFQRRKLTTGVTVLIMASGLLVLSVFTIVSINLGALLARARTGIDMRLFLNQELTAEQAADLQLRILAVDGVQEAAYISKQQALADLRADLREDGDLLDELPENPLPASFHITLTPAARTATATAGVRESLAALPEVSDIAFSQDWVEVLEHWSFLFRLTSFLVGMVVFLAAVFVISNTVRLTVASSERAIQIMKQVGATNSFIRTPFLCEGMLEGLLGGAVAMAVLCGAHWLLQPHIAGMIFFTPLQMSGFVAFCVGLGLVGSYAAMGKYLKL